MATLSKQKSGRTNKRKKKKKKKNHQRSHSVGFKAKSIHKTDDDKYVVPRKLGPIQIGRIKYKGTKYDESNNDNSDFLAEKLHKHSRSSSFQLRKQANPVRKRPSIKEYAAPNAWKKPSFYHSESEKMKRNVSRLDFLKDNKPTHVYHKSLDKLKDVHILGASKSNHDQFMNSPNAWKPPSDYEYKYDYKSDFLSEKLWFQSSTINPNDGFSHLLQTLPPEKLLLIENISNVTPTGTYSYSNYLKKIEHVIQLNLSTLHEDDDIDHNDQQITEALDEILFDSNEIKEEEEEEDDDEVITLALNEILAPSPSPDPFISDPFTSNNNQQIIINDEKKIDRKALIKTVERNLNNIQQRNISSINNKESNKRYLNKIPSNFICPISNEIISQAVMAADGRIYDKKNIENWLKHNDKSPISGQKLRHKNLMPFNELNEKINYWKMKNLIKKNKKRKKRKKRKTKSVSDLISSSSMSSSPLSPLSPLSQNEDDTNNDNDTNNAEIGIDSSDTS